MPLSELKEALTPKYSGDIRYKPTEEGKIGEGTTPTPIGLPEKQPEPSTTAAPEK